MVARHDSDVEVLELSESGGETRVNTTTTGTQATTEYGGDNVASDDAGNFVVVWAATGQDESSYGVFGQRYNSAGNRVGGEFRINGYGHDKQLDPQVVSAQLKTQATRAAKNAVVQMPVWKQAARKWLDQLESGRLAIQLEAEEIADSIESVEDNLDRNVRRLSFVLLIAGLLVGSAIASNAPLQEYLPPEIAVLLFVPFAIAVFVAILYLFRLLWESWKQRD